MADPQVTPTSGSSSSWGGPGDIAIDPTADAPTRLMSGLNQGGVVVTDGQGKYFIHHSRLSARPAEANSGLEPSEQQLCQHREFSEGLPGIVGPAERSRRLGEDGAA